MRSQTKGHEPAPQQKSVLAFNSWIDKTVRLQFRAEAFNAFNHPSFSNVGRSLTTTSSGVNPLAANFAVVTDSRDARVLQFALKLSF